MLRHSGSLQPLWNNRLPILSWTEHKIGKLVAQDRLLALLVVERFEQREPLITLLAERPHRFSAAGVEGRLRAGQSRRQHAALAGDRNVERQMMTSELQHPRVLLRRSSEDRDG